MTYEFTGDGERDERGAERGQQRGEQRLEQQLEVGGRQARAQVLRERVQLAQPEHSEGLRAT